MNMRLSEVLKFSSITYTRNFMQKKLNSYSPIVETVKSPNTQMDYIKSIIKDNDDLQADWSGIKNNILSKSGPIQSKNIDGVLLKAMISQRKFEAAKSFASYLQSANNELSLGSLNGILLLYHAMRNESPDQVSDEEKNFILDTYNYLYSKYKVLDFVTCERLLHALCVIGEWKKCMKILEDIYYSGTPSHSTYSTLIGTLFKYNKKTEAMKLIDTSFANTRPLQHYAYEEWINYVLRKYKDKNTIEKYLDDLCYNVSKYWSVIPMDTAKKLRDVYMSIGWKVHFTKLTKESGQCVCCKETLDCLSLTGDEFRKLQTNVKEKLIIGSDLFLKTSPNELKRFVKFVERTAPYDIVLDGLNIALAIGKAHISEKVGFLKMVADYFLLQNKKILLLGRKHMIKWPKWQMDYLCDKTSTFFTDDLSEDDPYFITAAILSGPHSDLVSKDLLRGHRFNMKDAELRQLFLKWQWQHQWMVFSNKKRRPNFQPPLKFTPCAQKKNEAWHLPCQSEETPSSVINNGIPDLTTWLCLTPNPER